MNLVLVFSLLFLSGQAFSKDIFACEGKSKIFNEGQTLHFRLSDEKGKLTLRTNGAVSEEKIKVAKVDLKNLETFLKCDSYDEKCIKQATGGNDDFRSFASVIAMNKKMAKDLPGDKQSSLSKLDTKKMAYGKSYQFGEYTKFGAMGVYEIYDRSDKIIGRYIYSIETMDCVNQANPTQDVGKMLKDAAAQK